MATYTGSMKIEASYTSREIFSVSINLDVTEGDFLTALTNIWENEMIPGTNIYSLSQQLALNFATMMEELKKLEKMLPEAIQQLQNLKESVDLVHKRCSGVVAATSAVSFTGGCLLIGGLVATPFTVGTSIGLTAVGASMIGCATVATTIAQAKDFHKQYKGVSECKRHQSLIEKCFTAAKNAYEDWTGALENLNKALVSMIPQMENLDKDMQDAFALNLAGIVPNIANKKMICSYASRAVPATNVAISPFSRQGITIMKVSLPAFKVAGRFLTAAGFGVAGLGLVVDAVLGIYSGHCFFNSSHRCKASETISFYIKELEHLNEKITLLITCSNQKEALTISKWKNSKQLEDTARLKEKFEERRQKAERENHRLSVEVNKAKEENQTLIAEARRVQEENQRLQELLAQLQGNITVG